MCDYLETTLYCLQIDLKYLINPQASKNITFLSSKETRQSTIIKV